MTSCSPFSFSGTNNTEKNFGLLLYCIYTLGILDAETIKATWKYLSLQYDDSAMIEIGNVSFSGGKEDDCGHGAHVAGILASKFNPSGIVGVAP